MRSDLVTLSSAISNNIQLLVIVMNPVTFGIC